MHQVRGQSGSELNVDKYNFYMQKYFSLSPGDDDVTVTITSHKLICFNGTITLALAQMFLNGFGRFFILLLKCTACTLCEQGKDLSYLRYSLFRLHNPKQ